MQTWKTERRHSTIYVDINIGVNKFKEQAKRRAQVMQDGISKAFESAQQVAICVTIYYG